MMNIDISHKEFTFTHGILLQMALNSLFFYRELYDRPIGKYKYAYECLSAAGSTR